MSPPPFIDLVVRGLVDDPESVVVEPVDRQGVTVYELRVADDDVGKVIGRKGATINALRAMVQVGGAKSGRRCALELIER